MCGGGREGGGRCISSGWTGRGVGWGGVAVVAVGGCGIGGVLTTMSYVATPIIA